MAIRYDFEDLLDKTIAMVKANLNTKLASIDTQKNDGITLKTFDDDESYFFQSLDDEIINVDPYLLYGIESIESDSQQYGQSADKITMFFAIIKSDNNESDIVKIMLRYQRALKEIFEENFTGIEIANKININSYGIVPFESLDQTAKYKAIGLTVESYLA